MASLPDEHLEQFGSEMDRIFAVTRKKLGLIQEGVKNESFEALSVLAQFGEHSQLCHSPCPPTAQEIRDVENRICGKKDKANQIKAQVEIDLNQMLANANSMSSPETLKEGLTSARKKPLDVVKAKTALIRNCGDDMLQSTKDKAKDERDRLFDDEYKKRAHIRRNETLSAVRQCLEASSEWPYGLEEICNRKHQADLVKKGDPEGKAEGQLIQKKMQALEEYMKDLEKKQERSCAEHSKAKNALGKRFAKMMKSWELLNKDIEEYLDESTKTAGLSILEERLATAIAQAEEGHKHAKEAKSTANPAAEALMKQAREESDKIHSKVKETAKQLQEKAEVPAQMSMENKEICRLLAQKVEEETKSQMQLVEKELFTAEAEKKELETVPMLNQQGQKELTELKIQVEQLQKSKKELSSSLSEAQKLQKDAGDQMKKLQELESVGYEFGKDLRMRKAKEAVDGVWTDLPKDEPKTEKPVQFSVDASENPNQVALIQQSFLQKLQEDTEKRIKKEKDERLELEEQFREQQRQMQLQNEQIQALQAALQAKLDDQRA